MSIKSKKDIESQYGKEVTKLGKVIKQTIIESGCKIPEFKKTTIDVVKYHANFGGLLLKRNCEPGEVFEDCNYYDANSMYPSMLDPKFLYPAGHLEPYTKKVNSIYDLFRDLKDKKFICTIWVASGAKLKKKYKNLDYNNVFTNTQFDKELRDGEIVTCKTSNFIRDSKGEGWTINLLDVNAQDLFKMYKIKEYRIINVMVFTDTFRFPGEVTEKLSNLKIFSNELKDKQYKTEAEIIKRAMNKQCFGKFCCRLYRASIAFGEMMYCKNYPIGAWIAAYAKHIELEHILKHIDNFIYCDTDSIVLQKDELEEEYIGTEFGKYKCEYRNMDFKLTTFKNYEIWKDGKLLKKTLVAKEDVVDDIEVHNNMIQIIKKIKNGDYEINKNNFVKNNDIDFDIDLEDEIEEDYEENQYWIGQLELDDWGNIIE